MNEKSKKERRKERVYLVPYPKIIFFYPTLLVAVALAILVLVLFQPEIGGELSTGEITGSSPTSRTVRPPCS